MSGGSASDQGSEFRVRKRAWKVNGWESQVRSLRVEEGVLSICSVLWEEQEVHVLPSRSLGSLPR